MSEPETVKVELDIPVNVYRAIEFICSLEPKRDLKKFMIGALFEDAESKASSSWDRQTNFFNKRLEAILKGEEKHDPPKRKIILEEETIKILEDLAREESVTVEAVAVKVIREALERLQ